ncbi:multidrug resistance-associated protein 1-like [Uloborus diversus]|uniref:multidrug resistance-associated protein 1-like n=1 Tax=Uloborus diversus TaxID=327109 RepID=UPI0024093A20|nr:multidrug resistance-associated protein 1-like [Uloborus diversus]
MTSCYAKGNTSLTRLRKFLSSEEREMSVVGEEPDEGKVISIRNAVFAWNIKSAPELQGINLHVDKGSLTAIVGTVGSGKSSLLSALVGDMHKISGSIDVKGTLAYVPQQAWILNQTFKENIVFNKTVDLEKYESILQCCCLLPDINQLPAADQTEIGEKGINLSGGQKQRISLARAVYQDADVYLLDDPLSAVDAHVGKDLFENVISNSGILAYKTRILVTHNVSVLPLVDMIIVMEEGIIKEWGTYEVLKENSGSFLDLIQEQKKEQIYENSEEQMIEGSDCCDHKNQTSNLLNFEASSLHALPEHQNGKLIEEEAYEIGQVKWITYYNYLKYSKFYYLLPSICSYMVYQVFEIFLTYSLSIWSPDDRDSENNNFNSSKYKHLYVILLWGLLQIFSVVSANSFLALAAGEASQKYQENLIYCLLKCPLSFFDSTPHGRIMNRCSNDLNDIDNAMPISLDCFLVCFFLSFGTFILIGAVIPVFLIGLFPIVVILYVTQKGFLMSSRQLKRLESTSKSPIYSHFKETIQGISSIYSYKVVQDFIETFERKTNASVTCYYHWILTSEWLCIRMGFFAVIIILTSAILCVQNRFNLNPSTIGLILIYCMTMSSALKFLILNGTALENSCISLERIDEYSNLTPEAPWEKVLKPPETWPEAGCIKFQNYSTCYRKGLPLVLKNLNFDIPSGKKVGIVGRTGAGKSSLTLALFRILEPYEGSIIIDNIDISNIGLHDLRSKLTIIPQDPVLFIGTLRLNLDPNGKHSDDVIWSTLEKTHLKEYFMSSSKGLDFEVSENGENLSAGQKQLICLARSLLRSSKILILDEATATVDTKTDSLIQDTIRSSFKDCTVITIAHRLNTVLDNDIIFVMDNAEVIESGKPSELLNSNSVFSSMLSDASFSK